MLTRFIKKGLQSRSATTSLLIKRNQFMEERTKLVFVLAQESKHIVSSCWGKHRCISPAERNYVEIGAVEKGKGKGYTAISASEGS